MTSNDPKELTFKNYKNTTYIEVTKVSAQDSNKKLAGAVFADLRG